MMDEHRQAAKAQLIAGMQRGLPWREAAATAGVQTSRTAAYRLLRAVRTQGDGALRDGRHGHASKLRGPVREWLQEYCRGAPRSASCVVQVLLQDRFGVRVSISQICRVRNALGVGRRSQGAGGK